ncbi:Tyrosine-protein phosphatase 1 [Leucoagaricus sp. SymC.cos]|nr:Tyrosine-protein phosphatase 1 [Leucoagaricus sp. SymC.cos]
MDFFTVVADPSQPIIHNDRPQDNANDSFAEAIANRFGSGALLTARLTPVSLAPPTLRLPASPMANMSLATPTPRNPTNSSAPPPAAPGGPLQFSTITPATLGPWTDDPTALILDIRAHAAYSTARVPCAVSLSVPSTLLKRPLFSLHRLADMLPSANARARFSSWRSASCILVYDADSSSVSESSNIYGLLRKFKNDGFQGDLAWLKGGFQAVWREKRDIIDAHPPTPDVENDDDDDDVVNSPVLNPTNPKRGPIARGATFPALPTPSQNQPQPAMNPFFDAVRQNLELSQGITERIPLRLPRRVRHPSEESEDDENTASADVEEGKEALAMQFFKIEVAEQRRLMGIMEHHTKETMIVTSDVGATPSPSNFPYSITAGVEKGAKNRYRHIWPFEHARVRLHQRREADDDYVNASYVQPLGTNKRYIATQGPLPATFTDFWTLCWEQNVHVIVMLTKEVENSMVKCGSYWTESEFGPLRLRLISTTGASPPEEPSLFPTPPVNQHHLTSPPSHITQQQLFEKQTSRQRTRRNQIIRRVFELTHTGYPEALPRRIVHLQYLEWPDLNVPDDPRGLLELLRQVDDAVKETHEMDEKTGISKQALGRNRPVMLHCSAGVGRTGGFIAVDVVLDAIRREMRASDKRPERDTDENAMDVDVPSGSTPGPIITSSVATVKDGPMSNEELPKETISLTIAAGNGCHEPVSEPLVPSRPSINDVNDASPRPRAEVSGKDLGILPQSSGWLANGQSSESATVVDDFKRPRPLHGTATPPNLTLFEEPVFEVVQDMREQRMSLCQSLRQYVFVHAAILEGALMIVDEERELVKERKRERTVEMSGLKIESERQEKAVISSRVVPLEATVSGRSDAGGIVPSQSVQDEGEGYFANFISQPPTIFGLSNEDSVDESAMESVFSPRPRVPAGLVFPPAIPVVQRPRHSVLDARFGKRSTSPSDYFRDRGGPLSLDDDAGLFKRPSVKRKQPSGEAGEIMTRKRAQNKSSSRERERERQLEGRLSNSSHSHPRDGAVDILTSGLVQ